MNDHTPKVRPSFDKKAAKLISEYWGLAGFFSLALAAGGGQETGLDRHRYFGLKVSSSGVPPFVGKIILTADCTDLQLYET